MTDSLVSRRSFLGGLAAASLGGSVLAACARGKRTVSIVPTANSIGLQLYTVRDLLQQDFDGTLEKLATIGYKQLEFAGYYNRTPAQVRATLDRLHLSSPSAHIGANLLQQDIAAQIASAKTIGQSYITIPSYNLPRNGTIADWKAVAAQFNKWGAACHDAGLKLGYHNHSAEFQMVEGRPGYDILLSETDPALVDFELDLYWARFAGQNPVDVIAKYPGRIAMWHVKDMRDAANTKAMSPVGQGEIDFKTIFAHASQSGLKYFFVEHDNAAQGPGGSLASVQASFEYLKKLLG